MLKERDCVKVCRRRIGAAIVRLKLWGLGFNKYIQAWLSYKVPNLNWTMIRFKEIFDQLPSAKKICAFNSPLFTTESLPCFICLHYSGLVEELRSVWCWFRTFISDLGSNLPGCPSVTQHRDDITDMQKLQAGNEGFLFLSPQSSIRDDSRSWSQFLGPLCL